MRHIVAYDLGTNTFRWFWGCFEGYRFSHWKSGRAIVGIGRALREGNTIGERDLNRALELAREWKPGKGIVPSADRARAVATHAFRVAENGETIATLLAEALGVRVKIISSEEEASLSFFGINAGLKGAFFSHPRVSAANPLDHPRFPEGEGRIAFLDIGGGSTEIGFGKEDLEQYLSIPLGVVTRRAENPKERFCETLKRIQEELRTWLHRLPWEPGITLGANCGTSTALAMEYLGSPYLPERLHGVFLPRTWLINWADMHREYTSHDFKRLPLGPERAELIGPGVAILLTVLEYFDLSGWWNSETGLLEGFALKLAKEG